MLPILLFAASIALLGWVTLDIMERESKEATPIYHKGEVVKLRGLDTEFLVIRPLCKGRDICTYRVKNSKGETVYLNQDIIYN